MERSDGANPVVVCGSLDSLVEIDRDAFSTEHMAFLRSFITFCLRIISLWPEKVEFSCAQILFPPCSLTSVANI